MKKIVKIFALLFIFFFIGCGEDKVNEITEQNRLSVDVVAKVKDLPECDSAMNGKQIWVSSEKDIFSCVDGDWTNEKFIGVPKDNSIECSTKELKDGSGVKVLCNGDSIGVLLYGEDAESEVDENLDVKSVCVLSVLTSDSLKVNCGSYSKVLSIDDLIGLMGDNYEIFTDSEQVAVRLENIGGYSQKGPFLTGSEVVAYEIENGRTMKQTGTKFEGRISKDDGSFNIRSVKLTSQYGLLSVNGFYLNEVSGGVSDVRIIMNAVSDFRNRNTVNVNVLTHMEYERILYLVTKKKTKFSEAKKKAEQEIWDIFHIDGAKFTDDAEDMNIVGSGDADAALLALSILLQRDGDASDLLSLITNIGNEIKENGIWKNDSMKVAIADWALNADMSGQYGIIRTNVEKWGLSVRIGDFESYLRKYWQEELGLGECSAQMDDSIAIVKNKISAYYAEDSLHTVLKCSAGRWGALKDDEKNVLGWKDSLDGALKYGKVNPEKIYVFDSVGAFDGNKGWRLALPVESEFGGCRMDAFGEVVTSKAYGMDFVCDEKSHLWKSSVSISKVDVNLWPKGADGDVKTMKNGSYDECYVFDTRMGGWRLSADDFDCIGNIMGCTLNRVGEVAYDSFYSKNKGRYYLCDTMYFTGGKLSSAQFAQLMNVNTERACELACDSIRENSSTKNRFVCSLYDMEVISFENELLPESRWDELDWSHSEDFVYEQISYCYVGVVTPVWRTINLASKETDTYGETCEVNEKVFSGHENPDNLYVCEDGEAVNVTEMEMWLGQFCYASVVGRMTNDEKYICTAITESSWDWFPTTVFNFKHGEKSHFNEAIEYGELRDERSRDVYKTIDVEGAGTWMAENLNYRNEDDFVNLSNNVFCEDRDTEDCLILGALYTWSGAMNVNSKWEYETAVKKEGLLKNPHQGICPEGWHIPTSGEWQKLRDVFDTEGVFYTSNGNENFSNKFFASNLTEIPNATNESGFSIIPWIHKLDYNRSISPSEVKDDFYRAVFISADSVNIEFTSSHYNIIHRRYGDYASVRCKKDDPVITEPVNED